ncbi:MAG: nucleotidyltransferase domain-containing protein [Methylocystis sp.]|nr:nucleotidyltransferase domain-containing protein [Methylocystis sp.]MBI3276051.1 nucleotidyltransferase domain-containing protein [Methylocystis sp.]
MSGIDPKTDFAAHAFLARLEGQYEVAGAVLFGSRARGDNRPESDADVLVLLRGPPGSLVATKLAMVDAAYEVELDTGVVISPLPVWEEEWEHPETWTNPRLLENIRREGVPL